MNKTKIPYLDFAWNPAGWGCSNSGNCPTCWARRQATSGGPTAPTCPDCRDFKVHFHPERLDKELSPAGRKKPAVVGVEFLGDLFDRKRTIDKALLALDVCHCSPQHDYVFLTQQYAAMAMVIDAWLVKRAGLAEIPLGWHLGATCTSAAAFRDASLYFAPDGMLWDQRWWVSAEPLSGRITPEDAFPCAPLPEGIIIGSDNQVAAACSVEAIRQTAHAFAGAGVKVFVKQMWLYRVPALRLLAA